MRVKLKAAGGCVVWLLACSCAERWDGTLSECAFVNQNGREVRLFINVPHGQELSGALFQRDPAQEQWSSGDVSGTAESPDAWVVESTLSTEGSSTTEAWVLDLKGGPSEMTGTASFTSRSPPIPGAVTGTCAIALKRRAPSAGGESQPD